MKPDRCATTRCPDCKKPILHRGHRGQHESSSHYGQIVHNLCPTDFTAIDVDLLVWRRAIRLLRLIEHKSGGQHRKWGQQEVLELAARIIEHAKNCPAARDEFDLHPDSGVFRVEGDPHEGNQLGHSIVTNYLTDTTEHEFDSEEDALCWVANLDEKPQKVWDKNIRRIFATGRDYVRSRLSRRHMDGAA